MIDIEMKKEMLQIMSSICNLLRESNLSIVKSIFSGSTGETSSIWVESQFTLRITI